jgi:hypothetical protein
MNFLRPRIQATDDSGVEPARDRNNSGRDEAETGGTNGGNRVTNGGRWMTYAIVAVAVLAFVLVEAFSTAHDAVRRGGAYDLGLPLLWGLTSAPTIIALAPLVDFGVRRLRQQTTWPWRAFWVAGTTLLFSALHIDGMVALRKLALATVGGSYHFGFSFSELVYEFRKDTVTCFMIGAGFWSTNDRGDARTEKAREINPSRPNSPHALWLRDGSARIRIEPRDIVWVSSAGNYVEYCLAGERTHLVRGTLAAEVARLTPFGIVRVHRTRLVNLTRVSRIKPGLNGDFELMLDSGQALTGSRRYRGAVASIEELAANPASVPSDNGAQR